MLLRRRDTLALSSNMHQVRLLSVFKTQGYTIALHEKNDRHPVLCTSANSAKLFNGVETIFFDTGGELFDHILAHRYLKERDACRLFAQLMSGVHYLHSKHIVHRDLKLVCVAIFVGQACN